MFEITGADGVINFFYECGGGANEVVTRFINIWLQFAIPHIIPMLDACLEEIMKGVLWVRPLFRFIQPRAKQLWTSELSTPPAPIFKTVYYSFLKLF